MPPPRRAPLLLMTLFSIVMVPEFEIPPPHPPVLVLVPLLLLLLLPLLLPVPSLPWTG